MEPAKVDSDAKTVKDPNPNPSPSADPKAADQGPAKKVGEDANAEIALSEVEIETKGIDPAAAQAEAQPPARTSSGSKKSVHWSPELVSGSQEPDQKSASSYPAGSNPYIARSPAETSDASLKGEEWLKFMRCVFIFCDISLSVCVNWIRYDGVCERSAREMGKEGC